MSGISFIGDIIGVVASSKFLLWGVVALVLSFALSLLSGLLEIARYIALVGGIGLLVYGVLTVVFPALVPAMIAF